MANEFKYTLTFESLSTGTGAKVTADGVDAVAMATDRLNKKQAALNAEFSAVSDRFDVTRTAYYDLGAEVERTRKPLEKMPEANNQVRVSSRNTSMALLELSRGFEDAQYGIRGVLNNIPSLVLSLGGTAGLAGAISIGAVALSQIIPLFTSSGESASETADKIKELTDRMGDAEGRRFDAVANGIEAARDRAEALRQEWEQTTAAEREFTTSSLSNAEKLAKAQMLIADALGIQLDRFKELEAIAAREAAAREQAARKAMEQEADKLDKAQKAAAKAAEELEIQRQRAEQEKQNLVTLRERLGVLQQQKLELEKLVSLDETRSANTQGPFSSPLAYQPNQAAQDARANLASPQFNAGIEGLQKRIADLEKNLFTLTKDGGVVAKAETALISAQTKLQDTDRAVSINIQKIEETLAADTTLAQAQGLVTSAQTFAKELQTALGKIQTNTSEGEAAKQSILNAAADGTITAKETAGVVENLRTLIGLMQTNSVGMGENTKELITLQKNLGIIVGSHANEIAILKLQMKDLQPR